MHAPHVRATRRALFLALLLPTAARASPWNAPEPHGGHVPEGSDHGPFYALPQVGISQRDITVIQNYYLAHAPANAPPAAPRLWTVGHPLPHQVPAEPLPPDLAAQVSPFYGYHYERVGTDVILLADDTRVVAAGLPILIR